MALSEEKKKRLLELINKAEANGESPEFIQRELIPAFKKKHDTEAAQDGATSADGTPVNPQLPPGTMERALSSLEMPEPSPIANPIDAVKSTFQTAREQYGLEKKLVAEGKQSKKTLLPLKALYGGSAVLSAPFVAAGAPIMTAIAPTPGRFKPEYTPGMTDVRSVAGPRTLSQLVRGPQPTPGMTAALNQLPPLSSLPGVASVKKTVAEHPEYLNRAGAGLNIALTAVPEAKGVIAGVKGTAKNVVLPRAKQFALGDLKINNAVAKKAYGKTLDQQKKNIQQTIYEHGLTKGTIEDNVLPAEQKIDEYLAKADEVGEAAAANPNIAPANPVDVAFKDIDVSKISNLNRRKQAQAIIDDWKNTLVENGYGQEGNIDLLIRAKRELNVEGDLFKNGLYTREEALEKAIRTKMYLNLTDHIGEMSPEVKALNQEAKRLMDAHAALSGAASRMANHDALGLTDWIFGTGATVGAVTHPGTLAVMLPMMGIKQAIKGGRGTNTLLNVARRLSGEKVKTMESVMAEGRAGAEAIKPPLPPVPAAPAAAEAAEDVPAFVRKGIKVPTDEELRAQAIRNDLLRNLPKVSTNLADIKGVELNPEIVARITKPPEAGVYRGPYRGPNEGYTPLGPGQAGNTGVKIAGGMAAGGVAGFTTGAMVGDTPEERKFNAILGGIAGLVGGGTLAQMTRRGGRLSLSTSEGKYLQRIMHDQKGMIGIGRDPEGVIQFHTVTPEIAKNIPVSKGLQSIIRANKENPLRDNPEMRKMATAYLDGKIDLNQAEQVFNDAAHKGIFGDIQKAGMGAREKQLLQEGTAGTSEGKLPWSRYPVETRNVERMRGNTKTSGTINTTDVSRGCATGRCVSCYAAACAQQSKKIALDVVPVQLKGDITKNPGITRFGEVGEPGTNPIAYQKVRDQLRAMTEAAQKKGTVTDIDKINKLLDDNGVNDWSYTMDQLRKVNANHPDAANKVFVITKLNSLKGFDPSVLRNLHVSVDPMIPSHFFRTLKNVDELLKIDPTLNITLRIKSVPTVSDDINSLMTIAAKFAKDRNLPTLDTRTRLRSADQLGAVMVDESVRKKGNQFVDPSYFLPGHRIKTVEESAGSAFAPFGKAVGMDDSKMLVCNNRNGTCNTCKNCNKLVKGGVPYVAPSPTGVESPSPFYRSIHSSEMPNQLESEFHRLSPEQQAENFEKMKRPEYTKKPKTLSQKARKELIGAGYYIPAKSENFGVNIFSRSDKLSDIIKRR